MCTHIYMCEIGIRPVSMSLFHSVFILKNPKNRHSSPCPQQKPSLLIWLKSDHSSKYYLVPTSPCGSVPSGRYYPLLPTSDVDPGLSNPPTLWNVRADMLLRDTPGPWGHFLLMRLLYRHWAMICHILSPQDSVLVSLYRSKGPLKQPQRWIQLPKLGCKDGSNFFKHWILSQIENPVLGESWGTALGSFSFRKAQKAN